MVKKRLAALCLALGLLLCAGSAAAQSQNTPLVYRVTDEQGHTLYLVGTIHVGDEKMQSFSPALEEAYTACDYLAVEIDLVAYQKNLLKQVMTATMMVYPLGDSAKNHLPQDVYEGVPAAVGLPERALKRMRPFAWLSSLQEKIYAEAGLTSENGLDMRLLTRAHKEKKPIRALESVDSQLALLADMPEDVIVEQLRMMLAYPRAASGGIRLLYTVWAQGDAQWLRALLAQDAKGLSEAAAASYALYAERMYGARDAAFAQQAEECLQSGQTVLFAVGAAHIVGQNGVVDRLAQAGYHIEEIGK